MTSHRLAHCWSDGDLFRRGSCFSSLLFIKESPLFWSTFAPVLSAGRMRTMAAVAPHNLSYRCFDKAHLLPRSCAALLGKPVPHPLHTRIISPRCCARLQLLWKLFALHENTVLWINLPHRLHLRHVCTFRAHSQQAFQPDAQWSVFFFMIYFLQAWGEGGLRKEVRLKLSRKYQPRLLLPLREKSGRLKAVMKTWNIKDPNNMKPNENLLGIGLTA